MEAWAARLTAFGAVSRFDYPYRIAGRSFPDKLPVLVAAHRAALEALPGDGPVVLAGKSMGGRIGCHLAADTAVTGAICFGFPLRSPAGTLRDAVLRALPMPALLLQGSRDPFSPRALLEEVVAGTRHRIVWIEGGNHDLSVGARRQAAADARAIESIGAWISDRLT